MESLASSGCQRVCLLSYWPNPLVCCWTPLHCGSTGILCSWGIVNAIYYMGLQRIVVPLSSAQLHAPLSNQPSLTKHSFKDKISRISRSQQQSIKPNTRPFWAWVLCDGTLKAAPAMGHQKMTERIHLRWTELDIDPEADSKTKGTPQKLVWEPENQAGRWINYKCKNSVRKKKRGQELETSSNLVARRWIVGIRAGKGGERRGASC